MGLKNVVIFLISLAICQYVQSLPTIRSTSGNYPNANIDDKPMNSTGIAGGNYARIGQFPFMALVTRFEDNKQYQCSGTIINIRWVLTTGSCVENPSLNIYAPRHHQRFFVRKWIFTLAFGIIDSDVQDGFLRGSGVSMNTTRAFVYPSYILGQNLYDIALLYMPFNIPFSDTIQLIALPYTNESFANKNGLVTGWGGSKMLKYAEVSVIQNTKCKRFGPSGSITDVSDNSVCTATGLGEDICQSGAPLIIKSENGRYLQIGILVLLK
ncbi:PREDICTED: venom serine protease Bi-VSP-like [Wasmannia auropunctata]|uniref:venom serine protease Bi-VSP-like n=1 Tax=Wasmannia auropunctata TaxID=64793 RepID=UPI0005EDEC7D|nr:PREDICTED: venom serine protease Bi-VSP-like [Wasmannia auropunctata]